MNKTPVAIVVAIIAAATMFASSAQAGIKIRLGFGGPLPVFTAHGNGGGYSQRHYHRKRYLARRVVKKEKVYVAKRKTPSAPKVAKQEKKDKVIAKQSIAPVAEPEVIADSENSSITTASLEPENAAAIEAPATTPVVAKTEEADVQPPQPKPAKAASKLDCKKFFPSVGMTLTVPCE